MNTCECSVKRLQIVLAGQRLRLQSHFLAFDDMIHCIDDVLLQSSHCHQQCILFKISAEYWIVHMVLLRRFCYRSIILSSSQCILWKI